MSDRKTELSDVAVKRVFGENVKRIRVELDLTQVALARAAKIGQRQVSKIENGLLDIRMSTAQRIARALFTTIDNLLSRN